VEVVGIGWNEMNKLNQVATEPKAKPRCFLPKMEANGRWERSSFCMDGLGESAKWNILDRHSDKPVVARSDLLKAVVSDAQLSLDPDWDPERHVNIVGWADDRAAQKSAAQLLSRDQRCELRRT
jgi:hypothetical protein